jgi:hypothetical protein
MAEKKTKGNIKVIETTLNKIAGNILSLDEASLCSLWEKYKSRMEHFDTSKEWEKAVIIFFIINSVRVKNHIFNEQILKLQKNKMEPDFISVPLPKNPWGKPNLRLVK